MSIAAADRAHPHLPAPPLQDPARLPAGDAAERDGAAGDSGGFGFDDLLDLINPLQHIPVVGTIYRELTGDEIESPARVAGGLLFGGPIGFVASTFETLLVESTGEDVGGHVMTALFDDAGAPRAEPMLASAVAPAPAETRDAPDSSDEAAGAQSAPLTGADALAALAADLRAGPATGTNRAAVDVAHPAPPSSGSTSSGSTSSGSTSSGSTSSAPAAAATGPGAAARFFPIRASDDHHALPRGAATHARTGVGAHAPRGVAESEPNRPAPSQGDTPPSGRGPGDSPPSDFAERMLRALDKYRAMHRAE